MNQKKTDKAMQYSKEYSQWLITQSVSNPKVIFTDIWSGISESMMLTALILYFIWGLQPNLLLYILTVIALEVVYKFSLITLNNEFLYTKLYEKMIEEISNESAYDESKGIIDEDGKEDCGDAPKDDTLGDDE